MKNLQSEFWNSALSGGSGQLLLDAGRFVQQLQIILIQGARALRINIAFDEMGAGVGEADNRLRFELVW